MPESGVIVRQQGPAGALAIRPARQLARTAKQGPGFGLVLESVRLGEALRVARRFADRMATLLNEAFRRLGDALTSDDQSDIRNQVAVARQLMQRAAEDDAEARRSWQGEAPRRVAAIHAEARRVIQSQEVGR